MAQADHPPITDAPIRTPTPEMAAVLALLLVLDERAREKKKMLPSVGVLEVLRTFAGAPKVVDIRRARQRCSPFKEASAAALKTLVVIERSMKP